MAIAAPGLEPDLLGYEPNQTTWPSQPLSCPGYLSDQENAPMEALFTGAEPLTLGFVSGLGPTYRAHPGGVTPFLGVSCPEAKTEGLEPSASGFGDRRSTS